MVREGLQGLPDPNRHLANWPDGRSVAGLQVIKKTRELASIAFHSAAEPVGALSHDGSHRVDKQRQKAASFRAGPQIGRAVRLDKASNDSRDAPGSKFSSKKVGFGSGKRVRGRV